VRPLVSIFYSQTNDIQPGWKTILVLQNFEYQFRHFCMRTCNDLSMGENVGSSF
jgi:hypothetical protein